jgi:hypothetical protein
MTRKKIALILISLNPPLLPLDLGCKNLVRNPGQALDEKVTKNNLHGVMTMLN